MIKKKYNSYTITTYLKKDFNLFLSKEFQEHRKEINDKTRKYFKRLTSKKINEFKKK